MVDDQAVTVDVLVEGVHWDDRLDPADVGFKSVAVSVSDLAACGAQPRWLLLALSLPRDPPPDPWVVRFSGGLHQACRAFGIHLVGGDVTRVPSGAPRVVSATAAGVCVASPTLRSGARPGDLLWITGTVGLAGAGWMDDAPIPEALSALRRPSPPLSFALSLAEAGLTTAAMDLSDGLAADLPRLAAASGVAVELDPGRLPIHPALAGHPRLRRCMLAGGEDYELLFTTSPQHRDAVIAIALHCGVAATPVGRVLEGSGAAATDGPWPESFTHFGAQR